MDAPMRRHEWASERLWEGLVVPSDEAWSIGIKTLAKSEFPEEVLALGGAEARGSARELARLLAKAQPTMPLDERSALYAELLLTCGTCHRAIRIARND